MPSPADTWASWPLLMDDRTLASMLTTTKPGLRRLVRNGEIPAARSLGGLERWHRDEVASHLRRIWGLDAVDQMAERHRELAAATLDGWKTPEKRRPRGG